VSLQVIVLMTIVEDGGDVPVINYEQRQTVYPELTGDHVSLLMDAAALLHQHIEVGADAVRMQAERLGASLRRSGGD